MPQILEKCYEYNIEMHVLFIDFKQAFDSVDKQNTIQILQELRIPNKLVRLIKMTIQNMEASVKIENLTSNPFSISSGVRQGNPLSATIFNLFSILSFHRVHYVVCFLLGISPVSEV
jgi:sorting nexin-29